MTGGADGRSPPGLFGCSEEKEKGRCQYFQISDKSKKRGGVEGGTKKKRERKRKKKNKSETHQQYPKGQARHAFHQPPHQRRSSRTLWGRRPVK